MNVSDDFRLTPVKPVSFKKNGKLNCLKKRGKRELPHVASFIFV